MTCAVTYDPAEDAVCYETVEDAFYFVSSASLGEHAAVLNRRTGEIFCASDMAGHYEMPDDLEYNDDYLDIPHRCQLTLAEPLVMEFVRLHAPQHLERLLRILSHPGAHSRFKRFLAEKNLLEDWFSFEMERVREALLEWGKERGIRLESRQK